MSKYDKTPRYYFKMSASFNEELPVKAMRKMPVRKMPHIYQHFVELCVHAAAHNNSLVDDAGRPLDSAKLATLLNIRHKDAIQMAQEWHNCAALVADENGIDVVPFLHKYVGKSTVSADAKAAQRASKSGQMSTHKEKEKDNKSSGGDSRPGTGCSQFVNNSYT